MCHRVLVVDDEAYICRLMEMVLEKAGYEVLQAYNADEGLRLLRSELPDLLAVDLMMPGRDGLQLLEEKAQDPTIRAIPAVVVTAVGVRADLEKAEALGAVLTLAKPFSQRQLLDAVAQACGG